MSGSRDRAGSGQHYPLIGLNNNRVFVTATGSVRDPYPGAGCECKEAQRGSIPDLRKTRSVDDFCRCRHKSAALDRAPQAALRTRREQDLKVINYRGDLRDHWPGASVIVVTLVLQILSVTLAVAGEAHPARIRVGLIRGLPTSSRRSLLARC